MRERGREPVEGLTEAGEMPVTSLWDPLRGRPKSPIRDDFGRGFTFRKKGRVFERTQEIREPPGLRSTIVNSNTRIVAVKSLNT